MTGAWNVSVRIQKSSNLISSKFFRAVRQDYFALFNQRSTQKHIKNEKGHNDERDWKIKFHHYFIFEFGIALSP